MSPYVSQGCERAGDNLGRLRPIYDFDAKTLR